MTSADLTLKLCRDLAAGHRCGLAELASFVARGRFPALEARILRAMVAGLAADGEQRLARDAEAAAAAWEREVAP